MPVTAAQIVAEARTWLDTPFVHQGRVRGVGVDCGGLLIGVARACDLEVEEPPAYSMSPDPGLIGTEIGLYCERVALADLRLADVLWFSFAGEPRHLGIANEVGVIHAWAKPGKVVEHRLDGIWIRRLRGVYRLRGLC